VPDPSDSSRSVATAAAERPAPVAPAPARAPPGVAAESAAATGAPADPSANVPAGTPAGTPTGAAAAPAGRRSRLALMLAAGVTALAALVPVAIDTMVSMSTAGAVAGGVEEVAPKPVALLLGTARSTAAGRPNQFYHARIDAAAALFHSGRVHGILVSGDNATRWYNEPIAMQKDLIAAGVPAEFITLDYAGFRTLDSVIRAKEVFGQERIVIVSQRFHAERAIFLARHYGIDASGLAAADPESPGLMKVRAREVLARVAAVLDIVTGRDPKFLGEPETVRLREVADDAV
jgi:SanA protein